jgi:sigma-B regulation protein RsbU (phosphoserine phosphatase)
MRLNLESRDFSGEAQLEAYLREVVATNPEIYGSCVAFEPNSFSSEKLYYAPYFYRKDGAPEFVQLGNPEYDYFKWDGIGSRKRWGTRSGRSLTSTMAAAMRS